MNMNYTNLLTAVNFNATSVSEGNEIKEADQSDVPNIRYETTALTQSDVPNIRYETTALIPLEAPKQSI
jgi:hypothetical protein